MARAESRLFPALLKYWRHSRGRSQLDLALEAEVSSRHLSFLETGRAQPSRDMVLRIGAVLAIPLRDQNIMLNAAGFAPAFKEVLFEQGLQPEVEHVITRMAAQQEPFPLLILNRAYDILRLNAAAERLLAPLVAEPAALQRPVNIFRMLLDPRLARPFIQDWESVTRTMVSRLHREALDRPSDGEFAAFIQDLLEYPGVADCFRQPDLAGPCDATCALRIRRDDLELGFLTTITRFSAPQNVTVDEIRIESYFPIDEQTARTCERLAGHAKA